MIGRPECEVTPIMIGLRLINAHYFTAGGRIDRIRISGGHLPFSNNALVIECTGVGNGKVSCARDRLTGVSVNFMEPGRRRIVEVG